MPRLSSTRSHALGANWQAVNEDRDRLDNVQEYGMVVIEAEVTADATGGIVAFEAPFDMRITDVIVRATATQADGTLTPRKGSDAMCTAIDCAADGELERMAEGATNVDRLVLDAGDEVTLIAAGGADPEHNRGMVTFLGKRL